MISVRASLFLKPLAEIYIHIREFRSAKLVSKAMPCDRNGAEAISKGSETARTQSLPS